MDYRTNGLLLDYIRWTKGITDYRANALLSDYIGWTKGIMG